MDTPKTLGGVDYTKYALSAILQNTIQLELQSGITLAILILQPPFFLPNMHCLMILRCAANLIKTGQKLHKLLKKNLEMLREGWNDRQAENSIPP